VAGATHPCDDTAQRVRVDERGTGGGRKIRGGTAELLERRDGWTVGGGGEMVRVGECM